MFRWYTYIFRGFKKYRVSTHNPNGFAFSFTEKHMFTMKTGRKSIFHPHEVNILARLSIIVLYTIFEGFEKYRVSAQKTNEFDFGFTEKVH
jgi:hypothetical protein